MHHDQRGDGGAVLRAGEAARQPPVLQRVGRRAPTLDQVRQNLDSGADAGSGGHVRRFLSLLVITSLGAVAIWNDSEARRGP